MPTYNKGKKYLKELGKDLLHLIYYFMFPAIVVGYALYLVILYIRYGDDAKPVKLPTDEVW